MFISITVFKINKFIIKEIYLESYQEILQECLCSTSKIQSQKKVFQNTVLVPFGIKG